MAKNPVQLITNGPTGSEMFRNISMIRRNTAGFLGKMHAAHGDIVQFPVPIPAFSINDPQDVDHVLRVNGRNYSKHTLQYNSLKLVTGEGLLTADSEIWKAHRRALQPAFHRTMQAMVIDAINDSYDHISQQWHLNSEIEIASAMQHVTLDVVGRSLFGTSLSGSADVIAQATLQALKVVVAKARTPLPIPRWLPTPNNLRLNRAVKHLDLAVAQLLATPATHPDAFISLLREAHESDPVSFDVEAIRDEIVTFIVAGHETVASATTWAIQLMLTHPEVYRKACEEARAATDFDTLANFPVLQSVFAETLRLYPPAWLITRTTIEPDVLGGVEIPANALIIMSPYLLHRGQRWDDPETFDPTRFSDAQSQIARSDYMPFGLGMRMCIGRDMALVEGPLLLARLLRDFDITPTNDWNSLGVTQSVTMHPTKQMLARLTPKI